MRKLLNTEEICKALNVTRKTLYNYRDKGMPYIKNGGSVLYDEEAVTSWIKHDRYDPEKKKEIVSVINVFMKKAENVLCEYYSIQRLLKSSDLFNGEKVKRREIFENRLNYLEKCFDIKNLEFYHEIATYEKILVEEKKEKINYHLLFKLCVDFKNIFRNARIMQSEEGDPDASDKE